MCLHTQIKAQQEICKVKTYSGTISRRDLLVERIKMKLPSRLIFIIMNCPDISRINKQCTFYHPKQFGSILYI